MALAPIAVVRCNGGDSMTDAAGGRILGPYGKYLVAFI